MSRVKEQWQEQPTAGYRYVSFSPKHTSGGTRDSKRGRFRSQRSEEKIIGLCAPRQLVGALHLS